MNSKILIIVALLFVVTGTIANECYQCLFCPKPFGNNKEGVTKVSAANDDYCFKTVSAVADIRGNAGKSCTSIGSSYLCCKGNLCNGATTATLNVKLLAAMASVFFAVRFFH